MITLAQLSDLHFDGGGRSEERVARVMAYLAALERPIDAVVVTGDIAEHGEPAEYERARETLESRYPVFTLPGNHDNRAAFREVLLGQPPSDEPVNQVREAAGAVFALGDSTIPGQGDGFLAEETLRWLDDVLGAVPAGAPAFVCFHHPPVELGIPPIDAIRQRGADRLAEVVSRHPQVVALLCGHAHTAAATTFAGRPLLVAPGVVSTCLLPFERYDGRSWARRRPDRFR